MDNLEEVFEIRDSEINVAEIMAQIRANLKRRPPLYPDADAFAYQPSGAAFLSVEDELQYHLEQAQDGHDHIFVGDQLRIPHSPLDRFLNKIRRPFHQLVRFYADLLAHKQVAFNASVVGALGALSAKLAAREEQLAQLRREVEELRQQIEKLRAEMPARSPNNRPPG